MAQKVKPTTKKTASPAKGPNAKAQAAGKRGAAVATAGKAPAPAGKLSPGKPAPSKLSPGKPATDKAAAGKAPAGKPGAAALARPAAAANAARGKLPSVADRARQATAAARAAAARAGTTKEVPEKKPRPRLKSPYSRKSLAPLKQKLLDLRARLAGDIDSMGREALRADEPEVDAENVADYGSDAFERTITLELMENEARTLRQINEALEAMEGGVFGVCTACGEPIPLARLEALPFAANCVKCQAAAERLL